LASLWLENEEIQAKTQKLVNKLAGVGSWIFLYAFLMLFTMEKLRDKDI
jgi:hypothetical protein